MAFPYEGREQENSFNETLVPLDELSALGMYTSAGMVPFGGTTLLAIDRGSSTNR